MRINTKENYNCVVSLYVIKTRVTLSRISFQIFINNFRLRKQKLPNLHIELAYKKFMTYFVSKITSSYIAVVSSLEEVTKSASKVHVTRMFNANAPPPSKKGEHVKTYAILQFLVNELVCNR